MNSTVRLLAAGSLLLGSGLTGATPFSTEPAVERAVQTIQQRAADWGLSAQDVADLEVSDHYRSRHNGVEHVWLRQRIDGLPVALGLANVNLGANGRVWSAHSRMSSNALARTADRQPTIDPVAALEAYARARRLDFSIAPLEIARNSAESFVFSRGSMADDDIPVRLSWLEHDGQLRLVWDVAVDETGRPDWFNAFIDAHDGEILKAVNWTQEAAYRVFPKPLEHPGEGPDELVSDPADPDASPLGWHDTGSTQYTDTRGNNTFAQEDLAGNNNPNVPRPDGGPDLNFDFPIDLSTQQPIEYLDFAVTNLFYWNNVIHDVLWHYGFDEPAGNFQVNNFGLGGLGGDPVRADAQDGSGTNNANFSTPPDGNPPRMQMFVWTGSSPATLRIDPPAASAGDYTARPAGFGPTILDPGTSGALELVDDGTANPDLGCDTLSGFTPGNIALVRRGNCEFGLKALNAQIAGAAAVVVMNNEGVNGTITMGAGANGNQVNIPTAMVGRQDGDLIEADLANGAPTARLFNASGAGLNRDSDLDAGVIAHEYGHGLSIRLTGGPSTSSCLFGNEQAGEGWSDYLGLWITATAENSTDAPRGIGGYLIFQENIPGATIRPAPYTRDLELNSLDYETLRNAGQPGGVSIPHGVGTVFNTALWDLYLNLVDKHGFDQNFHTGTGGNNIALQLVVDGLKLQPCGPTFLDTRDAMLLADEINYDGANQCEIWDAFARRGMGTGASDGGSPQNLSGITNSFEQPEICTTDVIFADGFEPEPTGA